MSERYGIILVDNNEIILRIYETDTKQWKLIHYYNKNLPQPKKRMHVADDISLIIADIFSSHFSEHIAEWKVCARNTDTAIPEEVKRLTGLPIEHLTAIREQELLCKGMFTELW